MTTLVVAFGTRTRVKIGLSRTGGGLDWMDLAQNENRQQVLVSIVLNHDISRKCGKLPEQLSDYQLLKQGSVPQVNLCCFVGPCRKMHGSTFK
jgi:hypothetical protein